MNIYSSREHENIISNVPSLYTCASVNRAGRVSMAEKCTYKFARLNVTGELTDMNEV